MEPEENEQGRVLYEELLWVHSMIRRDLETVRRLAAECDEGRPADELRQEISELETKGPLWRLKVNCLRYCRFVHSHHRAEDVMLFPRIREANPEVGPVVDRLEAEHRDVATHLGEVEAAAEALTDEEETPTRRRLSDALTALADHLLAHLEFEERNLESTIVRMPGL